MVRIFLIFLFILHIIEHVGEQVLVDGRIVNVVVRCCLANASVYIMINGSGALANNYTDTLSSLYL